MNPQDSPATDPDWNAAIIVPMNEAIKRATDTLRATPFGLSALALHVAGTGVIAAEAGMNDRSYVAAAVGIAASSFLIFRQARLIHRLEDTIERQGYNDRIFALTTPAWCDRQTARVVCQNAGVLPQYEELCEQNSDTARFTYIPHI